MSERKNELGKTQMTGAVFVDEARSYLDRLLHVESRGPGDFGNALHRIARRERLPHAALWGLRYRPPKDVYASTLFKLRDAYARACEHQLHMLEQTVADHKATGASTAYLDTAAAVVRQARS